MRSAASFHGHPFHPALIPFPLAFLVGALAFDAAGTLLDQPAFWTTARHLTLAGVAMALVAAVPGVIDYFRTVPPRSTAKRRATLHGLGNASATVLFAAAWLLRDPSGPPGLAILGVEAVGVALISVAGWMGGTLSFRNQIGVDHRYANAGKWRQVRLAGGAGQILTVAKADELAPNQMKLVEVDGRRIVVARTEQGWVAFDDRCTHRGGSLAGGAMMCGVVQCPWHGSQFDVRTGAVKAGPAEAPILSYPLEVVQGEVRLRLSDARSPTRA